MTFENRFFPHLLPDDIPVWKRFLAKRGILYTLIEYDIRVGEGRPAPPDFPVELRQMALDLSMRRIDAVCHREAFIDIVEITRHADIKAVGQLITYPVLYRLSYPTAKPLFPILVAEELGTDVLPVLQANNIEFFLYPPDETSTAAH